MVVLVVHGRLVVVLEGQYGQILRGMEVKWLVMGVFVAGLGTQDNVLKAVVHCM